MDYKMYMASNKTAKKLEKMKKEFNLSEKITYIDYNNCRLVDGEWIRATTIIEFIKRQEKLVTKFHTEKMSAEEFWEKWYKLAGDKLT